MSTSADTIRTLRTASPPRPVRRRRPHQTARPSPPWARRCPPSPLSPAPSLCPTACAPTATRARGPAYYSGAGVACCAYPADAEERERGRERQSKWTDNPPTSPRPARPRHRRPVRRQPQRVGRRGGRAECVARRGRVAG
jgi:hypothetical protein